MVKSIGITGTRVGWTHEQRNTFQCLLPEDPFEFHHGLCVGVDCQSHLEVRRLRPETGRIITHPSVDKKLQGTLEGDDTRHPLSHFARNRQIVKECDILIVVPMQNTWQERGGTWYTHDYGLKQGKPVFVIWPHGRFERRSK